MTIWPIELRRVFAFAFRVETALMLSYAAGLAATRLIGEGAAGQPLLGFAAPLAMGVLIKNSRSLSATDGLRLAAVHIVLAAAWGDGASVWAWSLFGDLAAIACGTATFFRLRASGFVTSQVRVAAAVATSSR